MHDMMDQLVPSVDRGSGGMRRSGRRPSRVRKCWEQTGSCELHWGLQQRCRVAAPVRLLLSRSAGVEDVQVRGPDGSAWSMKR